MVVTTFDDTRDYNWLVFIHTLPILLLLYPAYIPWKTLNGFTRYSTHCSLFLIKSDCCPSLSFEMLLDAEI